jgi:hypothetical protein
MPNWNLKPSNSAGVRTVAIEHDPEPANQMVARLYRGRGNNQASGGARAIPAHRKHNAPGLTESEGGVVGDWPTCAPDRYGTIQLARRRVN